MVVTWVEQNPFHCNAWLVSFSDRDILNVDKDYFNQAGIYGGTLIENMQVYLDRIYENE